jgi:phage terminase large subunit-like protein
MNDDELDRELGRVAAEIAKVAGLAQKYRRMDYWLPYIKQKEFFDLTLRHREVALFAASQGGKSESAAFMMAVWMTGLYPKWWKGRRFNGPIRAWVVGDSLKMTRDICQKKLCGEPGTKEEFGAGFVPRDLFVGDPVLARGEGNAYDTIQVRHVSGGISTLRFRTYSAGRVALQGETLDVVWCDEEPDDPAIYGECLARVTATSGLVVITFTPLKGLTGIALRFLNEPSPDRAYVMMGLDDIPPAKGDAASAVTTTVDVGADGVQKYGHIPLAERERIIAGYLPHERESRSTGKPALGSGLIYQTPESLIVEDVDPLSWPTHWRWGWGLDRGIDHPTAFVLMAHDTDRDQMHVVAEYRASNEPIERHVQAVRAIEKEVFGREMQIPVAYPHDAKTRDASGAAIKDLYARCGLKMMPEPASLPGKSGVEARSLEGSIAEIDMRERQGAWWVSRRCRYYLEERRMYHRKDGEVVPLYEDTLCAARYAYMMRRYFKDRIDCGGGAVGTAAYSQWVRKQSDPGQRFAKGSAGHPGGHYDLFGV